ncbi:MAG TPA: Rieske 2Fe-2S domain-containing protein, partial [Thermoanaerobaculia bacterium]|nr:Rieske 2Fe-2S domain-containing protein [Thermoanaerobaculia bacterium]
MSEATHDLAAGIRASDLADGAMLSGQVGEDTVLLARRGDEFFALDAFCTHYHAPLADGALIGDTIRCPWHHACFELRSGAALGAPAMRPLRKWSVTREGEMVRVGAVVETPSAAPSPSDEHVVI